MADVDDFAVLPTRAQVSRLRATARAALSAYPIEPVGRLALLNHGYNTTFRVDTADGRRFALRLNVNSRKTPALLDAETSWLAALRTDTDLLVPTPLPTFDGRLHSEVWCDALARPLPVVVMGWLGGSDIGAGASLATWRKVGRAAATLHSHAERWSLPAGSALPAIDTVLYGIADVLDTPHPDNTAARRSVLRDAFQRSQAGITSLLAGRTPIVLHSDLHQWNVKSNRGSLAIFDFDDIGMGVPAQDLAISAFYLRPDDELEAAMHAGYSEVRPLPDYTVEQYEAMLASRNLLLLNDMFTTTTAEYRAWLPTYLHNTELKLRHYLRTGRYRHDVDGVHPLG